MQGSDGLTTLVHFVSSLIILDLIIYYIAYCNSESRFYLRLINLVVGHEIVAGECRDFGFDPLGFGEVPENLERFKESELIHARWAMLAIVSSVCPILSSVYPLATCVPYVIVHGKSSPLSFTFVRRPSRLYCDVSLKSNNFFGTGKIFTFPWFLSLKHSSRAGGES